MSKTVANVGCGIAAGIALLWVICCCSSLNWVTSSSIIVNFEVTLLSVYTMKGTVVSVISYAGQIFRAGALVNKFMTRSIYLSEARPEFCAAGLDTVFHWCGMWTMVTYGSWFMLFCIVLTVVFLLAGAGSMYYYSNVNATKTGRHCCRMCYGLAPACAFIGLCVYTACTHEFGANALLKDPYKAHALYAGGYFFAWFLAFCSWLPFYSMLVFMRGDPLKKEHKPEAEELPAGVARGVAAREVQLQERRIPEQQQQAYPYNYGASAGASPVSTQAYGGTYGAPSYGYAPNYGAPANSQAYGYGGQVAQYNLPAYSYAGRQPAQYNPAASSAPPPNQPGYGGYGW